jgi:hypothetical protein
VLGHTARRLEGAQRREAAAEPGLAGRTPTPVTKASGRIKRVDFHIDTGIC